MQSSPPMQQRRLIHSFPRPKAGDSPEATLERAISILSLIKKVGLVLAPEVIEWDLSSPSSNQTPLRTLQRRICFTEIEPAELTKHCASFGPLALSFDIERLRESGAMPVIYIPQGLNSTLSQIATFCVNGAHHTKSVLGQLQQLKEVSDPSLATQRFGHPVAPNYNLDLKNNDSAGNIVASYSVPATHVQQLLQHVGFNNIPFDHSIGVLGIFLNMFYPTDNLYQGELLGYYRQREWRLIASDVKINGRPMGRELSVAEKNDLTAINPTFWNRAILVDGNDTTRQELALVYEPIEGWNIFDFLESIYAPECVHARVRKIVGDQIPIYHHP